MNSQQKPIRAETRTTGSQTLSRGLSILRLVTESAEGLTNAEVVKVAGVHRTVAYRILNTLCDAQLLHRGPDGRYRGAAGLLSLAAAGHQHLRSTAIPHLHRAADELEATVALLVREGNRAVALAVVPPTSGTYHITFSEGAYHPLSKGAAGIALLAAEAPSPGDSEQVVEARSRGYAKTFGEVEPHMYGLAVPLPAHGLTPTACLNVITVKEETATSAIEQLRRTATELLRDLNQ